jgi:hypothetical protein
MEAQTTTTTTTPGPFTEIQINPSVATTPNSEKTGGLKIDHGLFVWLVFLALGGGILALYYAQIGYFPNIEWHSLLLYLAAATILGASLGILFSLLLFLPGCIWAELILSDLPLYRIFYPDGEPCVLEIIRRLGVLFGAILLITHFLVPMGQLAYWIGTAILLTLSGIIMWWSFQKDSRLGLISGVLLLFYQPFLLLGQATYLKAAPVFFIASLLIIWIFTRRYPPNPYGTPIKLSGSRLFKYAFWFVISVILSQASMLLTYYLAGTPTKASYYHLTVFCTSIVIVSNHIVAARYCHHRKQAMLASLVAAFLILCAADHYTSLSQKIMAFYGFGGGRPVSILLNEDGAKIIDQLGLSESIRKGQPRTRICNVELLSTVGTEFCLSYEGINFTLPKSVIISWTAIDPRNNHGNQSLCDEDSLTTH